MDPLDEARKGSISEAFTIAFGLPLDSGQARRAQASPADDDVEDKIEHLALELLRTQAKLADAEAKLSASTPAPTIRQQVDEALSRGTR